MTPYRQSLYFFDRNGRVKPNPFMISCEPLSELVFPASRRTTLGFGHRRCGIYRRRVFYKVMLERRKPAPALEPAPVPVPFAFLRVVSKQKARSCTHLLPTKRDSCPKSFYVERMPYERAFLDLHGMGCARFGCFFGDRLPACIFFFPRCT